MLIGPDSAVQTGTLLHGNGRLLTRLRSAESVLGSGDVTRETALVAAELGVGCKAKKHFTAGAIFYDASRRT